MTIDPFTGKGYDSVESEVISTGTYKASNMKTMWDHAKTAHKKKDRLFKLITAVDNGEPWSTYKGKIRKSQSLPVSNFLPELRDTRLGSLSTEGFVGEFVAENIESERIASELNDYFSHFWRKGNFDDAINDALSNTLTYGTGAVLVSQSGTSAVNMEEEYNIVDDLVLTNIDPETIYPEPEAKSPGAANYFFIKETATLEYLRTITMFQPGITKNYTKLMGNLSTYDSGREQLNSDFRVQAAEKREADFITYLGRVLTADGSYRWDFVYMFAGEILHVVEDIAIGKCPLVFLYERKDKNSFWGQGEFKKNLSLALQINELDSAFITHAKKQQDPPAIVKRGSGVNVADFAKNRDEPGRVFTFTNGASSDAITYLQLPDLPRDITSGSEMLANRLQSGSAAGGAYSGADMGSVQTAGGISQVLDRATMKDRPIIKRYAQFLKEIYSIIVSILEHQTGFVRFAVKNHNENEMEYGQLNLADIDWSMITVVVDLAHHTAASKENAFAVVQQLFQQSVQYQSAMPITEPALMTTDEFLLGLKEKNVDRLITHIENRRQREREMDMSQKVTQIIAIYLQLVSEGMMPQEAIMAVAQEFATDPSILKGLQVAELAKQQQAAQASPGGMQGQNGQTAT